AAGLVSAPGRAIEPGIDAPDAVDAAGIGGIGVVDDVVFADEGAHARPVALIGRQIGAAHRGELADCALAAFLARPPLERPLAPVVIFDVALTLLILAEPHIEVDIKIAWRRRRPGEGPAHSLLVF